LSETRTSDVRLRRTMMSYQDRGLGEDWSGGL
jgi:hypothetical protein